MQTPDWRYRLPRRLRPARLTAPGWGCCSRSRCSAPPLLALAGVASVRIRSPRDRFGTVQDPGDAAGQRAGGRIVQAAAGRPVAVRRRRSPRRTPPRRFAALEPVGPQRVQRLVGRRGGFETLPLACRKGVGDRRVGLCDGEALQLGRRNATVVATLLMRRLLASSLTTTVAAPSVTARHRPLAAWTAADPGVGDGRPGLDAAVGVFLFPATGGEPVVGRLRSRRSDATIAP